MAQPLVPQASFGSAVHAIGQAASEAFRATITLVNATASRAAVVAQKTAVVAKNWLALLAELAVKYGTIAYNHALHFGSFALAKGRVAVQAGAKFANTYGKIVLAATIKYQYELKIALAAYVAGIISKHIFTK